MDDYLARREQLIKKDRALRVDARVAYAEDDVRARAADVVRRVERAEKERIWNQEHEGVMHVFPGMQFLTGAHACSRCACPRC
jgi:adenosine deaminase CECR1